jgi:hypothetical protein
LCIHIYFLCDIQHAKPEFLPVKNEKDHSFADLFSPSLLLHRENKVTNQLHSLRKVLLIGDSRTPLGSQTNRSFAKKSA